MMRKNTIVRAATALATAAVATTLTLTPAANANTAERVDARGDAPRHIDLTRAVIDNGDSRSDLVKLRIRVDGTLRTGDSVTVWFNRDPSNPGPELRLAGFVNSEYAMRRVNTWSGPGRAVSCDLYKMKQFDNLHGVRVRIDRSCLGDHPVRVAIRAGSGAGDSRFDWFDSRRTFLPGVLH
jgi:hypothetical protein